MNERQIFSAARRISDPQARHEYLKEACGDDCGLYERILSLLRSSEAAGSFLESPASALLGVVAASDQSLPSNAASGPAGSPLERRAAGVCGEGAHAADHAATLRPPVSVANSNQQIGPYKVRELLAEGGMGAVDRLRLFVSVCRAVQHAHLKGIIHRDLKPSNVLVEVHDVQPVPKVIDFGFAKAINQRLGDHAVYTNHSQVVGTPLYMSPEQAQLSSLDVDTRSDVYSLGVLMYELLTGTTPFDRAELDSACWNEMRRHICEVDPPRPSHRVSTLANEHASTISHCRQTEPHRLSLSMKRELDWIVMKCLEKDRARRYESASDLADDIGRYLNDEPVEACPPSVTYRW